MYIHFLNYVFIKFLWFMFQRKKYSVCKKFKYCMPSYIDQLAEMFHGTTVDGRTSYVAEQNEEPTYGNFI